MPQTVGRINQVADRGDGDGDGDENENENEDEDKYKYEDEIPNYALLLTALVKRFGVSRVRDFFYILFFSNV